MLLVGLVGPFAWAVSSGEARAARPRAIEIRGRVTDASGSGIPGVPVRLLQGRRDFKVLDWSFEDRLTKVLLVRTDPDGFFEATLQPNPEFRYFWLRFYDPESFDAVRFQRPPDLDITWNVLRGRPVIQRVVLEDHPDWPRVQEWIERLGSQTPQARLVRGLGLPDRYEEAGGVERFWYSRQGLVYRFQEGRFLGQDRYEPAAENTRNTSDS